MFNPKKTKSTLEVEITMKAAKENEAVTAEQWARESIRIARVTRELLILGKHGGWFFGVFWVWGG